MQAMTWHAVMAAFVMAAFVGTMRAVMWWLLCQLLIRGAGTHRHCLRQPRMFEGPSLTRWRYSRNAR